MLVKKYPRVSPEESEDWVRKFNNYFQDHSESGIIFVFAGSLTLQKVERLAEKKDFEALKKASHKIILLKEPEAKFIASKDLEKNDFHINVILNDIGDDVCFCSQASLSEETFSFEINPGGRDHYVFVLKTENFSEEEKKWIEKEESVMTMKCQACASNSKEARHEHFGVPKEKIVAMGSH